MRVATLLATIGKEVLEINCQLPMTEVECKNPNEIIEKLKAYFKQKKKCNLRKTCSSPLTKKQLRHLTPTWHH